ncbi:uncharacterized protein LOC144112787 isoform X1 [Amblyomma americanum]
MWILRQQDDAICATLDLLANIFGTVVEHSVSKGSSRSISAADAEVVQGALPGWPVAVAPGCQLLCRRQQRSPGGVTLPSKGEASVSGSRCFGPAAADSRGHQVDLGRTESCAIVLSLLSPVQGIREVAVSLAQAALNSSHKGCSRPHLLFKEIDQHAAEVAADTEELLELIVTWSHGLKKQNTLLVLLNHPQVPVAMQNGILQLVTHVDSKVTSCLQLGALYTLEARECNDSPTSFASFHGEDFDHHWQPCWTTSSWIKASGSTMSSTLVVDKNCWRVPELFSGAAT